MKYPAFALVTIISATSAAAEPHLNLYITADEHVIAPGDSVNWQIWAELIEPEQPVLATVVNFSFSLTFGGVSSLNITDNNFSTAFDSTFVGPADDGTVIGDAIFGAEGVNMIPPLNNPGGPDSSNPLFIYSFTMIHNGDGGGEMYTPELSITSMSGAYDTPVPIEFAYTNGTGPGVSFNVVADTVYNVPPPATGALALISLAAIRRRSR